MEDTEQKVSVIEPEVPKTENAEISNKGTLEESKKDDSNELKRKRIETLKKAREAKRRKKEEREENARKAAEARDQMLNDMYEKVGRLHSLMENKEGVTTSNVLLERLDRLSEGIEKSYKMFGEMRHAPTYYPQQQPVIQPAVYDRRQHQSDQQPQVTGPSLPIIVPPSQISLPPNIAQSDTEASKQRVFTW